MKILELELLETTLKFRSTVPFDLREIVPVLHVHVKVADLREIIPVLHVHIKVADLREIIPVLHVHVKVADLREIIPFLHVHIKVADRRETVNDVFIQDGFLCNVLNDRFIRLK